MYGFFGGGDPRRFVPDHECCEPDELERHRQACAAWDRGERPDVDGSAGCHRFHEPGQSFGLGTYVIEWECEGPACFACRQETRP